MVDKIEMSLDDIIKTNKIGFRRSGGSGPGRKNVDGAAGGPSRNTQTKFRGTKNRPIGGGSNGAGGKGRIRSTQPIRKFTRGDVNSTWKHDMFEGSKKQLLRGAVNGILSSSSGSAKLLVSNLDYGVSETDIHELFADFGPLKTASVHYDRSGRSLGTADVLFERRADAVKAMKQYNGVPLDGRPMNIQLATSEVPAPTVIRKRNVSGGGNSTPNRRPPVRRGPPNRGGNRPAAARPAKPVSAEELDAELDAYVNDMKL